MVRSVFARVVDAYDHGVIVQIGPVCLELICSQAEGDKILRQRGQTREIPVLLELTESSAELLGFHNEEARTLYLALRKIHGIGRITALSALSAEDPIDTLRAVAMKDRKFLTSLEGLGPKRASALIEELTRFWHGSLPKPVPCPLSDWIAARDVLMSKGISRDDAEQRLFEQFSA